MLGLHGGKIQLHTNFGTDSSKPFKWIPQADQDVVKLDAADEKLVNRE